MLSGYLLLVLSLFFCNLLVSGCSRRTGSRSNHHRLFGIWHVMAAVHGVMVMMSMLLVMLETTMMAFVQTFAFWVRPMLFHHHWLFNRWKWGAEAARLLTRTMVIERRLWCCHWDVTVVPTHWQWLLLTWNFFAKLRQLLFHFTLTLVEWWKFELLRISSGKEDEITFYLWFTFQLLLYRADSLSKVDNALDETLRCISQVCLAREILC